MKLVEIDNSIVPSACNTSDMRKRVCRFGVVRYLPTHGRVQDLHDAFAEVERPKNAIDAVKKDGKWFWAIDDGKREPSDNLP